MSKRIEYNKGQVLGPYGLIYIKEVEPYIQPSNKRPIRQAEFECPHCNEHKHFITRIAYAKNGHTKSCGCLALQASVDTIQQYNALGNEAWNKMKVKHGDEVGKSGVIFIKDLENKRSPQGRAYRFSRFICPICGDEFDALFDNVKRDRTKGCGKHSSYGEEKIRLILEENNIQYKIHYNKPGCANPKTNWPFFFDFYLPQYDCYIEYDGEQHFIYHEGSCWNDYNNFIETQQRDKAKNKYCVDNNLILIRIPYTHKDNIVLEDLLPETSSFIYKEFNIG